MQIIKRESWFSRLASSVVGVGIGLLLSVIALPLLFWNEGRAVKTARGLAEGERQVQSAPVATIDPARQGQLIHVQGPTFCEGQLRDDEFGVSVNAIRLNRIVEMFQWSENEKTERRRRVGGSTETVRTYTYEQKWSSRRINSDAFHERQGHENPSSFPVMSRQQQADEVFVGAFQLPKSLIDRIEQPEPLRIELASIPEPMRQHLRVDNSHDLIWPVDHQIIAPQIGDTRIRFTANRPTDVSIVAQQAGSRLDPFATSNGRELHLLSLGRVSAQEMFDNAKAANTMLTWAIRAGGCFLAFAGFALCLSPLSVLADVIPLAGSVVRAGTTLVAFLLASVVALVTISVGWIAYRPLLGIALLSGAALFAYALFKRLRPRTVLAVPAAAPPPPSSFSGYAAATPPPPPPRTQSPRP